jgi:hypothetical protein
MMSLFLEEKQFSLMPCELCINLVWSLVDADPLNSHQVNRLMSQISKPDLKRTGSSNLFDIFIQGPKSKMTVEAKILDYSHLCLNK